MGENRPLAVTTSSALPFESRGREVDSLGTSRVWRCCRRWGCCDDEGIAVEAPPSLLKAGGADTRCVGAAGTRRLALVSAAGGDETWGTKSRWASRAPSNELRWPSLTWVVPRKSLDSLPCTEAK